ncbi:MAG: hypothetical protein ACYC2H_11205 [Thermoplasmatota archaeon]
MGNVRDGGQGTHLEEDGSAALRWLAIVLVLLVVALAGILLWARSPT